LLRRLLREARVGSPEALGRPPEGRRGYPPRAALRELRAPLQTKIDAVELVQGTFIEAAWDFACLRFALQRLPDSYGRVFELRFGERLSFAADRACPACAEGRRTHGELKFRASG
jgi:hypothetical protein